MKRIISSIFAGICLLATMPAFANIAEGFSGSCKWVIDNDGNLDVSFDFMNEDGITEGVLESWVGNAAPWHEYCESITTVNFSTAVVAHTCSNMFNGCSNLKAIYLDNLYTDDVTDMSNMFANCTSLEVVEFRITNSSLEDEEGLACIPKSYTRFSNNFSTSAVKNMSGMFAGCKSLQSFYLPDMDMHSVTDFSNMFADCISLEAMDLTALAIQKDANVTDMFKNCSNLMNIVNQSVFPTTIEDDTFLSLPTRGLCSVDVPLDCIDDYEAANGWRHLFSVENGESSEASFQSTAISNVKSAGEEVPAVYALNGNQLSSPVKGINIIAGKKVAVK